VQATVGKTHDAARDNIEAAVRAMGGAALELLYAVPLDDLGAFQTSPVDPSTRHCRARVMIGVTKPGSDASSI